MNEFARKVAGRLALLIGMIGILVVVSLLLFFVGIFQNIAALSFMGSLNDLMNGLAGFMSAVLASVLHLFLRSPFPRLSWTPLLGVWIGAIVISYGSWLIMTGRAGVELSSYYFFFGNGLIGIWLWTLNHVVRAQAAWPHNLIRLGLIASLFMMVGLLGLYGIVLGLDGSDYSPLVLISGLSFLGIGILYPIWCILLGRWLLRKQNDRVTISPT